MTDGEAKFARMSLERRAHDLSGRSQYSVVEAHREEMLHLIGFVLWLDDQRAAATAGASSEP